MSTVLAIVCHPSPKSYTHAVADAALRVLRRLGVTPLVHDLYAEGFDPVLSESELKRRLAFDDLVVRHVRDLEAADGLLLVHPEWWGAPPAMLKGWMDRVLRPGIGYEFRGEEFLRKEHVPLLAGKRALLFATTDAAPSPGTPLLCAFWREALSYCGIDDVRCEMLFRLRELPPADRREWLKRVEEITEETFRSGAPTRPTP